MVETDTALIRRLRDVHDSEAWALFSAHYRPLFDAYSRRISRKLGLAWANIDVEEVVQDVLIRLARALPKFTLDKDRGKFRSYLWRVVMSAIASRKPAGPDVRSQGDFDLATLPQREPDEEWNDEYHRAIKDRVLGEVRQKLCATNETKWRCFEGQIMNGRPAAQVAAELGIKKDLVYQNSKRVLDLVRALCLERFDEEFADVVSSPASEGRVGSSL